MRENLTLMDANYKGADQPGHPRSLISTFVFHSLQIIISNLASYKISLCWLVCIAELTDSSLTRSEIK